MDRLFDWTDLDKFFYSFPIRNRTVEMDQDNRSFKIAVPGYGKEDLSAKINEEGHLIISGDNGEETFERKFNIPGVGLDTELKLTCEKGILHITLPENKQKLLQVN